MLRELGVRLGRPARRLPGSPDIVSLKHGWAIQVHGCFWHQHPACPRATLPMNNRQRWREKFAGNRKRDARLAKELRALGFRLLVLWACHVDEHPARVAARLARYCCRQA